jgi:hypothetical protein
VRFGLYQRVCIGGLLENEPFDISDLHGGQVTFAAGAPLYDGGRPALGPVSSKNIGIRASFR